MKDDIKIGCEKEYPYVLTKRERVQEKIEEIKEKLNEHLDIVVGIIAALIFIIVAICLTIHYMHVAVYDLPENKNNNNNNIEYTIYLEY